MKTIYKLAFFLLIAITLSCQQELSPDDYSFRGNWDSNKYALQIFKNGYGVCDRKNWGRCEGDVKIKGTNLIFTSDNDNDVFPRKKFKINEKPTTDSLGVTYMVLDGSRFEKH